MRSLRLKEHQSFDRRRGRRVSVDFAAASFFALAVLAISLSCADGTAAFGWQGGAESPVIVQPGAPGKPTKALPSDTKAALPPLSKADVDFMQGMIMHHAQAVEMTALIASHTEN